MKKAIYFLILAISPAASFAQMTMRQERNLTAFAKLLGYVEYFHPSDEAQKVYWGQVARFGSQQMIGIKNDEELIKELKAIFNPIAPTVKIYPLNKNISFCIQNITPPNPDSFKVISWQHLGINLYGGANIYSSIRLNRLSPIKQPSSPDTLLYRISNPLSLYKYKGKVFKFSVEMSVSPLGEDSAAVAIDELRHHNGTISLTTADKNLELHRHVKRFTFTSVISNDSSTTHFVVYIATGKQRLNIKNPKLIIEIDGKQNEIDLEAVGGDTQPKKNPIVYSFGISAQSDEPLFKERLKIGEYIQKELVPGISCIVPLALWGTNNYTYPKADTVKLNLLIKKLNFGITSDGKIGENLTGDVLKVRLGIVMITWNVLKHSFPYWQDAKVSPDVWLHKALKRAFTDKTSQDFLETLESMSVPLNDGHFFVNLYDGKNKNASVPLLLTAVGDRIVIKDILADSLNKFIKKGDIISFIDKKPAYTLLVSKENHISGSEQWRKQKAVTGLLNGPINSLVTIHINRNNKKYILKLQRNSPEIIYEPGSYRKEKIKSGWLSSGVFYADLTIDSWKEIQTYLPDLVKAKSVIFEMRGYPNSLTYDILSHLLTTACTDRRFQVPQIIYPDYKKVTYKNVLYTVKPNEPHITAKIYLLTDASAQSAAESMAGFFKDCRLATIIGQPTSGTNGTINILSLVGQYQISFSGMLVTNNNGSKHHLTGVTPDITVVPTIDGIKKGKDEVLEKAIELATKR